MSITCWYTADDSERLMDHRCAQRPVQTSEDGYQEQDVQTAECSVLLFCRVVAAPRPRLYCAVLLSRNIKEYAPIHNPLTSSWSDRKPGRRSARWIA